MENFKEIINYIFSVLKLENITGLDAIRHCNILVALSFITIKVCQKFDIPTEYGFENFLKDKKGNIIHDENIILKKYYSVDKQCFLKIIFEKGSYSEFKFKIESPINFINIYKKLYNLNHNECKKNTFDLFGIIYQLYLDKCNSVQKKELGQYFTNRHLINYVIELCNPKLKENNEIESILDPSSGTGGFLSMSCKYLNKNNSNINWDINKKNIYGFDNNSIYKSICQGSVGLEIEQLCDKTIIYRDTLCEDYRLNNSLIDKVDVIMCDIPFGIRNFKFASACPRIKQLKFDGTKAEPLFLQLILQSLNKNGRAAIIIPDNLLENNAKLHTLTRQYLIENLNLKKVISIDDKLLNLGISQSIIYFENNGKTETVEFLKLKFENNKCIDESILNVKYDEIKNNNYYLYTNKYIIQEKKYNLDKIKNIQIKEVCKSRIINPMEKINNKNDYIIINNSSIKYYSNEEVIISKKSIVLELTNLEINLKYVYYYLLHIQNDIENNLSTKNTINLEYINNIEVPTISNLIIEDIVTSLDLYHEQIELNNKKRANYDKICKNIFWSYCYNKSMIKLSEIVNITILKDNNQDQALDCIYIDKHGSIVDYANKSTLYNPYICIKLANDLISYKYLYYYLKYNRVITKILESSTISKSTIENLSIALLTKSEQFDLIKMYDTMTHQQIQLSIMNNDLLNNNLINRVLNLNNSNLDNYETHSSCSATSKNMNVEY